MANGQAIALDHAMVDCPYRVEVASSWEAVAARWHRSQKHAFGTPFQTAHWLSNWYQVFGKEPGIEPAVVTVFDSRSGEEVLLVPLIMRMSGTLRTVEFADLWATDYNCPLICPGAPGSKAEAAEIWRALVAALPTADRFRLTKMLPEIRGRPNPLALMPHTQRSELTGFIVSLPENWDDYVRTLKRQVRSNLDRRWRRLREETNAEFRWIEDVETARGLLAALHELQIDRLEGRGVRHVFNGAAHRLFYERHIVHGLSSGAAVMTAIVAGDEVVAILLAVADGQCCTVIRASQLMSDRWRAYGLGKLIVAHSMQALHQRGYRRFDLSVGDLPYKHDFGVTEMPLFELDVAGSWRALPALARDRLLTRLKRSPLTGGLVRSVRRARISRAQRELPTR